MENKQTPKKKPYHDFMIAASRNGMSELEATKIVLSVYEAAIYRLKLKPDELFGVSHF